MVFLKKTAVKSAEKRNLLRKLLDAPVSNVCFSKNRVYLDFLGYRVSDSVVIKREKYVADWSRRRKQVFVDREILGRDREKSFRALCVHEAVEKFLCEKFGLNADNEAHVVATRKEREYLKKIGGNWRSHELIVYWDWHLLGEK
ncbi:MAG: hypothetical protein V1717_04055 [Candidatus Micrarchaeota archaeon]